MSAQSPCAHRPPVSAAPAANGAARLIANRRPSAPVIGTPTCAALRRIVITPTVQAISAADSHTAIHRSTDG